MEQAAKVTEEKLLFTITGVQSALTTLMEIALKENRMEDAAYLADVDSKCAKLFDLWNTINIPLISSFIPSVRTASNAFRFFYQC